MKPKLTMIILTIITLAGCTSLDPVIPTATNTLDRPADTPTPTAAAAPDQVQNPSSHEVVPVGVAVQRTCQKADPCLVDGESLSDGSQLVLIPSSAGEPAAIYLPPQVEVVHIASPVDFTNPESLVYIIRSLENNQFEIVANGEIIRSFDGTNIFRLLGAPAQQVFALAYLPGATGPGGTDSGLSEILVSPGVGPMVVAPGGEWLMTPVMVHGSGQPLPDAAYLEMYYTYQPYGIGGEITFPPYRGLYYLQGNGEDHQELLPQDLQFSALSPNTLLAAYTQPPWGGLVIRDLESGRDLAIPLLPGSEKGAGSAVFSPDANLLAWMEARGSLLDGNFESVIRIASTGGDTVAEFSASDLQTAAGFTNVIIRPAGWLDNQRLLLQVYVTRDLGEKILLVVHIDGAIEEASISGTFIGTLYGE